MLRALLWVGVGGGLGSMARYAVTVFSNRYIVQSYPAATLMINIVGCFLIGLLFGLGQRNTWLQGDGWLLLATGFCGGFTTFSAFALENIGLMKANQSLTAIVYTALSIVLGFIMCRLGIAMTTA